MQVDVNKIDELLRELLDRHATEKSDPGRFKEKMLAMGSEGGRFVESIVRAIKPKRGLEIGTSSGFSALCAFRSAISAGIDFHLVTVDFDPAKGEWASNNFVRAGVHDNITIVIEDGLEAVKKLPGPWDYVLLDAAKSQNLPIFQEILPKLNTGAVVLTDNMLTHVEEQAEFAAFVRNHPDLSSAMFPIGNGVEVTFRLTPRVTDKVVVGDAPDRVEQNMEISG